MTKCTNSPNEIQSIDDCEREIARLNRMVDEAHDAASQARWEAQDAQDDYRALESDYNHIQEQHNQVLRHNEHKLWAIIERHADVFSLDMVGRRDVLDMLTVLIDELAQSRRTDAGRAALEGGA